LNTVNNIRQIRRKGGEDQGYYDWWLTGHKQNRLEDQQECKMQTSEKRGRKIKMGIIMSD
jgi:hypothetical protein